MLAYADALGRGAGNGSGGGAGAEAAARPRDRCAAERQVRAAEAYAGVCWHMLTYAEVEQARVALQLVG